MDGFLQRALCFAGKHFDWKLLCELLTDGISCHSLIDDLRMFETDPLKSPGIHEKKIRAHFKDAVCFDGKKPVFQTPLYLLAFSNRSGSNLLASHLRSTRYFGGFREQLNHEAVFKQAEEGDCKSFPEFFEFASTNYGKGYEAWGFKASWDQIMMLYRFGIDRMYPSVRIIHSQRRNLIEQAVSYLIASQTKKWTSQHEGDASVEPKYDYKLLKKLVTDSAAAEINIRMITVLFDLPYLPVNYEAVTRNPDAVMQRVAQFARIDLSQWKLPAPPIAKQANAVNQRFYDRYVEDRRKELLDP